MGIGPSMKETSLHYYRDPMVEILSEDSDVNLRATLALLIGGIYYLSLHAKSNGSTFCGIDINIDEGKSQIDDTIKNIIYHTFDNSKKK